MLHLLHETVELLLRATYRQPHLLLVLESAQRTRSVQSVLSCISLPLLCRHWTALRVGGNEQILRLLLHPLDHLPHISFALVVHLQIECLLGLAVLIQCGLVVHAQF